MSRWSCTHDAGNCRAREAGNWLLCFKIEADARTATPEELQFLVANGRLARPLSWEDSERWLVRACRRSTCICGVLKALLMLGQQVGPGSPSIHFLTYAAKIDPSSLFPFPCVVVPFLSRDRSLFGGMLPREQAGARTSSSEAAGRMLWCRCCQPRTARLFRLLMGAAGVAVVGAMVPSGSTLAPFSIHSVAAPFDEIRSILVDPSDR